MHYPNQILLLLSSLIMIIVSIVIIPELTGEQLDTRSYAAETTQFIADPLP